MKRLITSVLLLAALCLPAGRGALAQEVTRLAVIVGNNYGLARSEPLKYAERDASRMARLLQEIGGVRAENLTLLTGAGPDELRGALDAVNERAGEIFGDVVFVFYYSGHADSGWLRMGGHGIPLTELRRRLELMPAKVRIAIVDACQSGEITRSKGGKVLSPFLEERPVNVEGLVILTSASAAEPAQESDVLRSSFFSHHLMSGLRGPADRSGDDQVSASEAYDYAYRYTVRETEGTSSGPQHPTFLYALEGEGDVTLTAVDRGRARIKLAAAIAGTVLFVGAGSQIEAEVVKRAGAPVNVALRPGRYEVRWRAKDALWIGEVQLADGDAIDLDRGDFQQHELSAAATKGVAPLPEEREPAPDAGGEPRPLTDVPLGGGTVWSNGHGPANGSGAAIAPGPEPPPAAPAAQSEQEEEEISEEEEAEEHADARPPRQIEPGTVREYDDSRSFARHDNALLWPPLAAGVSLVGPGVPQIIDQRHGTGGVLLGLFLASAAGSTLLFKSLDGGDSEEVRGVKLGGGTALGFAAFYTYAYSAIDAFYTVTKGGPGTPDLAELDFDLGIAAAPALMRTTAGLELALGGGLGFGVAVHPNVVIGLRNISAGYQDGIGMAQAGLDLRLRGMIVERIGWSAAVGLVGQFHYQGRSDSERLGRDSEEPRMAGGLYPYLAGGLHYFPARSWSLDFGIRGSVAVLTRRYPIEGVQPATAFSLEYIGGLSWYH